MRITVRLDDELIERLKAKARKENTSLSRLLDRMLRAGLRAPQAVSPGTRRFKQKTHAMGSMVNLDKALALAAALEDEEILGKLSLD